MSLANYTDLQTAISEWLYRTGDAALAARAPDLIALFEADFIADPDMRTMDMQTISTTPVVTAAVALPPGYLDMIRVKVLGDPLGGPDQELTYVTPARAGVLDASIAQTTPGFGVAKYYTVLSNQIFISPQSWAPAGATMELVYNQFVGLAAASGGVNWLLTKYPNLYLYGSLTHAAAYVDDKETVAFWKAGRDEVMAKLARTIIKHKLGAGPLRMGASTGFCTNGGFYSGRGS